jgi:hypothetical protein
LGGDAARLSRVVTMTDPETIDPLTLVPMGVSGAGKSRVMPALAERLGAVSAEGDTFHSAANVAKMAYRMAPAGGRPDRSAAPARIEPPAAVLRRWRAIATTV